MDDSSDTPFLVVIVATVAIIAFAGAAIEIFGPSECRDIVCDCTEITKETDK